MGEFVMEKYMEVSISVRAGIVYYSISQYYITIEYDREYVHTFIAKDITKKGNVGA